MLVTESKLRQIVKEEFQKLQQEAEEGSGSLFSNIGLHKFSIKVLDDCYNALKDLEPEKDPYRTDVKYTDALLKVTPNTNVVADLKNTKKQEAVKEIFLSMVDGENKFNKVLSQIAGIKSRKDIEDARARRERERANREKARELGLTFGGTTPSPYR